MYVHACVCGGGGALLISTSFHFPPPRPSLTFPHYRPSPSSAPHRPSPPPCPPTVLVTPQSPNPNYAPHASPSCPPTVVVTSSVVEMAIDLSPLNSQFGNTLSVLRAVRLLRILRLARSWEKLQVIIRTLLSSLESVGYLTLLLLLFMFIFALLGMQVRALGVLLKWRDSCSHMP